MNTESKILDVSEDDPREQNGFSWWPVMMFVCVYFLVMFPMTAVSLYLGSFIRRVLGVGIGQAEQIAVCIFDFFIVFLFFSLILRWLNHYFHNGIRPYNIKGGLGLILLTSGIPILLFSIVFIGSPHSRNELISMPFVVPMFMAVIAKISALLLALENFENNERK